jgi:hypothetical protein
MIALLKNLYLKAEGLSGKRLIYVFVAVTLVFLGLGLAIGYATNSKLNKHELDLKTPTQNLTSKLTPRFIPMKIFPLS